MSSPPSSVNNSFQAELGVAVPAGSEQIGLDRSGPILHEADGSTLSLPLPPLRQAETSPEPQKRGKSGRPQSGTRVESPMQDAAEIDPRLVQETQQQIKQLVEEISQLTKQNLPPAEFYLGFATRCVSALSSIGGAIWLKERNQLNLEQQINLAQTGLPTDGPGAYQHDRLLKQVFQDGQPTLVLPSTVNASDDSGNPTALLLILAPIMYEGQAIGLIEIFQRPVTGPVTQRGYLRFLVQMAEMAAQYHKNRRLRELDEQQDLWGRLDQFLQCLHESLDTQRTAYNLANDGRRLIDCDRVSVALAEGMRLKIVATSGLDRVHRRADQVRLMEQLTTVVCRAKQPLFYVGPTDELAPQIEECLESYLDLAHSKAVAIVPLVHGAKTSDDQTDLTKARQAAQVKKKLLGALIIEQLTDQRIPEEKTRRIELVAQHGASALANSLEHNGLFLMPLWKALGKLSWLTAPQNLPKTGLISVGLLVSAILMFLLPYSFTMPAKGILQPANRYEVYSQTAGLVTEIPLPDEQNVIVSAGQPLVKTVNRDFDSEYQTLIGKAAETLESLQEKMQIEQLSTEPLEKLKVQGEIRQLRSDYESMREQTEILNDKLKHLVVHSPVSGQIVGWKFRETLMGRWLMGGERLMTVVDLEGPWELELYLPERGASHVLTQIRRSETPVEVSFTLASQPGKTYVGTVSHIDQRAEVREIHGNSLRLTIAFDEQQVPDELKRMGTGVTAKIHCGRRPLGYVLFREVWETAQAQILFWL
ncbi:MAG: HlyD family efflux transporter periplasmic adaptor subunit [Planctomycetaceae bacterium]|nr:HlyD family efflux transporter periplasmic adaptor subunit [Planctomycetaceae bacterium]